MRNRIIYLIIFFILYLNTGSYADFETAPLDARIKGFSGAGTAGLKYSGAVLLNPASIAALPSNEVVLFYEKRYLGLSDVPLSEEKSEPSGLSDSFAILALPFKKAGSFALAWSETGDPGLYTENIYALSYARKLNGKFLMGVNVKAFTVKYAKSAYTNVNPVFAAGYSKTAFSGDFGLLFRMTNRWFAGLSVRDINEPDTGLKYENKILREMRLGFSYCREKAVNSFVDFSYKGADWRGAIGLEKDFGVFTPRAGFAFGKRNLMNASAGFTLRIKKLRADYVVTYPLSGLETLGSHGVSIGIKM